MSDNESSTLTSIKAGKLAQILGNQLIGKEIMTFPMGIYPGGKAVVLSISPDSGCPEIVFEVDHPVIGEIGVFEEEEVIYYGSLERPADQE
jgi:hypothetical protein